MPDENSEAEANFTDTAAEGAELAEAARGEQMQFRGGFAPVISAQGDISVHGAGALAITAGRNLELQGGGAAAFVAGGNMSVSQGGGQVFVAGGNLQITEGGGGLLVTSTATIDRGYVGLLFSGQTELRDGARVLFNTPQAMAFGAAFGLVFALVSRVIRRHRR